MTNLLNKGEVLAEYTDIDAGKLIGELGPLTTAMLFDELGRSGTLGACDTFLDYGFARFVGEKTFDARSIEIHHTVVDGFHSGEKKGVELALRSIKEKYGTDGLEIALLEAIGDARPDSFESYQYASMSTYGFIWEKTGQDIGLEHFNHAGFRVQLFTENGKSIWYHTGAKKEHSSKMSSLAKIISRLEAQRPKA